MKSTISVLNLITHDGSGTIEDGVGDLLAAGRGQAVHPLGAGRPRQQRVIDLEMSEVAAALLLLRLLAHRGPHIGVDDLRSVERFPAIAGDSRSPSQDGRVPD